MFPLTRTQVEGGRGKIELVPRDHFWPGPLQRDGRLETEPYRLIGRISRIKGVQRQHTQQSRPLRRSLCSRVGRLAKAVDGRILERNFKSQVVG